MLRKILCVFALLAQGGDTWSFHLTPCAAPSAETARTARTGALSIAETVCALKCPTEPVLERFLAPFAGQAQEPLLSLRRLDDFCDPRITRTLAIAVAVLDKKIFWKKCHTDDEDRGGCMTPFSDKDTWRWLRMLQEILEVVDVKDALFLVQCGDEPNVPTDEEAFPVFHSEGGDGFWNIPWLNPFHLKALHKELLSPGPVPIPWASKMRKVYWRGSLTAPNEVSKDQASSIPRLRIFQLAKEKPELFDVAVNSVDNHLKVMWGKKTVQRIVSQHGVNFSNFEAVEQRARHYRYVLNLNGVVSSWRLSYLLGTGSVLLLQKSSTNEALHALLEPWRHYVPLAPDLSNLLEVLQQLESNETWAQTLAQAAADLFAERLRPEDIYCFALRSMEVSQSTELTLAALEARNFQAAPSLESLDAAWRGRLPKRLSQRLAAMHDALLRRPSSHTEL